MCVTFITMADWFVQHPEQLGELAERLRASPYVAVDTEFMRTSTYYARLCLVQVATEDVVACVDPLALDIQPLLDVLYAPGRVKVLHSAGQDLEVFHDIRRDVPRPLYDSQIAAAMLGHPLQIGYAGLVQAMLGVELDKSHARTDWARRPLSSEQVQYAGDDVRYLREVYHRQGEALAAAGRATWAAEEFEALGDPAPFAFAPQQQWKRFRGIEKMEPRNLQVLRALAAWREDRARAYDKPRRWILADTSALEIARRIPDTLDELAKVRDLEPGTVKRRGRELLAVVEAALLEPEGEWPVLEAHRQLTPAQDKRVKRMMDFLALRAQTLNLPAALLSSRRDLERLVAGDDNVPIMQGWRREVAGNDLLAIG